MNSILPNISPILRFRFIKSAPTGLFLEYFDCQSTAGPATCHPYANFIITCQPLKYCLLERHQRVQPVTVYQEQRMGLDKSD